MKNFKRIILLLVVMTLLFSISGCTDEDETIQTSTVEESYDSENTTNFGNNMIIISESKFYYSSRHTYSNIIYIVYDKNTYVMYCIICSNYGSGTTMTPLYNADGTLQTYNPEG